jgi:hypothetical protein
VAVIACFRSNRLKLHSCVFIIYLIRSRYGQKSAASDTSFWVVPDRLILFLVVRTGTGHVRGVFVKQLCVAACITSGTPSPTGGFS